MLFHRFILGDMVTNCYLIADEETKNAVLFDAPAESNKILDYIEKNGLFLKKVLLTHAHFDHILDCESWAAAGAEVLISEDDRDALPDPVRNCFKVYYGIENGYYGEARGLKDGEILKLGDTEIRMIKCPGHTIGCATYVCEDHAFVGDTLFAGGGFGRTDLPTSNFPMLRESIFKLICLPETVMFYPGHGKFTTVKQYRRDIWI